VKGWPILAAGTVGGVIGFLGTVYVDMAFGLATSLTTKATVVICPVMYAIWLKWWLVPIFNALLYGGIAFRIAKWRGATAQRAGQ
jgi:hypothetical protein